MASSVGPIEFVCFKWQLTTQERPSLSYQYKLRGLAKSIVFQHLYTTGCLSDYPDAVAFLAWRGRARNTSNRSSQITRACGNVNGETFAACVPPDMHNALTGAGVSGSSTQIPRLTTTEKNWIIQKVALEFISFNAGNYDLKLLMSQTINHTVFLLSALAIALTDCLMSHSQRPGR